MRYRLTDHARQEVARRYISEEDIAKVLAEPEQTLIIQPGRVVLQSTFKLGGSSLTEQSQLRESYFILEVNDGLATTTHCVQYSIANLCYCAQTAWGEMERGF